MICNSDDGLGDKKCGKIQTEHDIVDCSLVSVMLLGNCRKHIYFAQTKLTER